MANDLEPSQPSDVSGILARTIKNVAEGITGIAASERKDLVLSVGDVLQQIRGGKFLSAFKKEWDTYKERGRIKDEFEQSGENLDCLQELLDFVDKDIPDSQRFEAMRNLYLNIAVHSASDVAGLNYQQMMKLCRSLSSGELIVLLTVYRQTSLWPDSKIGTAVPVTEWFAKVAEESGLHTGFVALNEPGLVDKGLLLPRSSTGKAVLAPKQGRLTDLALLLCRRIAEPPSHESDS